MSGFEERKPGGGSLINDAVGGRAAQGPPGPGKRTLTEQLGNGSPTAASAAASAAPTASPATAQPASSAAVAEAAGSEAGAQVAETPTAATPAAGPQAATEAASPASLSLTMPAVVRVTAPDGLRVRRTPDANTRNVVGGLHFHEEVEAHGRQGEWLAVTCQMMTAYVHSGYVELAPHTEAPTMSPAPVTPPKTDVAPPAPTAATPAAHPATPSGGTEPAAHPAPAPAGTATTAAAPPIRAKLEDPTIVALAAKVHDPKLDALLFDIATVLALDKKLRPTKTLATRFEVKGKERAQLVDTIGAVRAGLAQLSSPSDPNVAAFKIEVNHRLEEIAPYHFQLNIPTIESVGGWSTCNLTSLAMTLEVLGKGASAYPATEHKKLLAVAEVFKSDIAQARLATNGTGTDLSSLTGLRFPDFLELAAVVEFIGSAEPTRDEIVAAAAKAVTVKGQSWFLKQLANKFGAQATSKSIPWDTSKTTKQNRATTEALEGYGHRHRGDGSHGVEQLSTARNAAEKETNPKKKAALVKQYEALLVGQKTALEGKDIDKDLDLETYKSAVIRELGPVLDAGGGVIAGVYQHWVRLYGIHADHILVQDPGAWNRTEINLTWAEARAMGYFWANLVIS